ncbi:hypothetical protein OAC18_00260 [Flavobacteriaceae bacterium]|nr:hypothetical protein [Flavobacteriaceae bacterium]
MDCIIRVLSKFKPSILSGNIWIVVCGGYLNHILIIFFTASTIALWNKKK